MDPVGAALTDDVAVDVADLITRTKGLDDIHDDLVTVDTVVDAVKAKTDNLPSDPASESNIRGADNDTLETISDQIDGILLAETYFISDDILHSNDAVEASTATSYTKCKTIYVAVYDTTMRIKFDHMGDAVGTGYAQIYKNGAAHGTGRATGNSWTTYSEDLAFVRGDTLELWYHGTAGSTVSVRNFRVYGLLHSGFSN